MSIRIGTLSEARATRSPFMLEGNLLSHKGTLMGGAQQGPNSPNAYLIEQEPHQVLPVHFHAYGQFQVAVRGSGTLGSHMLAPLSVHYAGQRAAYGPIVPGADGLWYMTLRPRTETGAFFMPQSMALRSRAIPAVHAMSKPMLVRGRDGDCFGADAGISPVLEPQDSGLGAWLLRIAPGESLHAPAHRSSGGRFHIVVGGQVVLAGRQLGWLSTVWSDPGDETLECQAAPGGAEVLALQFPADACLHPPPTV